MPQGQLTLPAIISCEIEGTLAVETFGQVDASGSRGARVILAVHNILLTVLARESRGTDASIAGSVVNAGRSILASFCVTSIVFVFASNATVIRRARAVQSRSKVSALAAVHAGVSDAAARKYHTFIKYRTRSTILIATTQCTPLTVPARSRIVCHRFRLGRRRRSLGTGQCKRHRFDTVSGCCTW